MSDHNRHSRPVEGAKGVVENLKGKVKEAVGAVTGRDNLTREGHAQQDKGQSDLEAARKEAEADKARLEARAAEERQKFEQ